MRYAMIAAAAAAAVSLATVAGAQGAQRTAAQNAWCAVHVNECNPQRETGRDRADIVKDLHRVKRNRQAVRANVRDLRSDEATYDANPSAGERRDMQFDRARIARERTRIRATERDRAGDRRDIRHDRRMSDRN